MTDTTTTELHITADVRLGDLVTARPALARPLQGLGLDFCCGGASTLGEAAAKRGLDTDAVIAELSAIGATSPAPWRDLAARDLVDHIESTHHRFLWDELPRVGQLVDKIVQVHGERHPELGSVQDTFNALRHELEPHMRKEELMLFPAIRALAGDEPPPAFPFGSVRNPISVMLSEHDQAGELLERLREQTAGYQPPSDGCATYQAAFSGLEEIEADTHLHVHKENNLLFPMVVELEDAFEASGSARKGTMEATCHAQGLDSGDECQVDGIDVCEHTRS